MVDKSRSRKEGGAGLGLALCQKIIELHGAVWRFESEVGQGLGVSVMFWDPEHQKPCDGPGYGTAESSTAKA